MAVAWVTSVIDLWNSGSGDTDTTTSTPAITTTGADCLVLFSGWHQNFGGSINAPTDSKGNSWTQIATYPGSSNQHVGAWISIPTSVGSSHTFTQTHTSYARTRMMVAALSGVAAVSPVANFAGSALNIFPATIHQPGSVTPTGSDFFLLGGHTANGGTTTTGYTIDSGFTEYAETINGITMAFLAYKQSATSENPTVTYAPSNYWPHSGLILIALNPADAGGGAVATRPQFGASGILPREGVVFYQARTRPLGGEVAVVTPPPAPMDIPLLLRAGVLQASLQRIDPPGVRPTPIDVPLLRRMILPVPPVVSPPPRLGPPLARPLPPTEGGLQARRPFVVEGGTPPPPTQPTVITPPIPPAAVPLLQRPYAQLVGGTTPVPTVPPPLRPIAPAEVPPAQRRRAVLVDGASPGPDILAPIPPAAVPLLQRRRFLVEGLSERGRLVIVTAPIPPAHVPATQRQRFILVGTVHPVRLVPPVIAPIPPGTANPPTLLRRGFGVGYPWDIRPIFEPLPFTAGRHIRRVTRWTAEDRCAVVWANPRTSRWLAIDRQAVYATNPRTVRWTRDGRSAIMPEHDDHDR